MAMKVERGEARELVPAGNYLGVLIGIYDIGSHAGQFGVDHQCIFQYELHKRRGPVRNSKGEVLTISAWHYLKLGVKGPSPLCKTLEALTGTRITEKNFSIDEGLLDRAIRLTVSHAEKDGNVRDQIDTVMPLDEDDDLPKAVSDTHYFEIGPDREIPKYVPEWVAKQIRKSREFGGDGAKVAGRQPAAVGAGANGGPPVDDDVPF